jgi:hypothetical protein
MKRLKNGTVEFTVKIRIKPDRLEWFSAMSDQLGLTRGQAVSGMLESNMEADSNGIGREEAQTFIARGASVLFPERKTLKALERAFAHREFAEQAIEKARDAALIELHDTAPKEMDLPSLHQTKAALLRSATSGWKAKVIS